MLSTHTYGTHTLALSTSYTFSSIPCVVIKRLGRGPRRRALIGLLGLFLVRGQRDFYKWSCVQIPHSHIHSHSGPAAISLISVDGGGQLAAQQVGWARRRRGEVAGRGSRISGGCKDSEVNRKEEIAEQVAEKEGEGRSK